MTNKLILFSRKGSFNNRLNRCQVYALRKSDADHVGTRHR